MSTESAKNDASVVLEDVVVSLTSGSVMGDLGDVCSRMLTRLDLGVAGFSEKVSNLTYFVMYVEIMECKIEASVLEKEKDHIGCLEKGLQFDLLSVLLNSEATELREVFNTLQGWVGEAREWVLSDTHLGEAFVAMQDKLVDYEQQLNQSEEELNDIEIKSADFQRTLATFKKAEIGEIIGEDDKFLNGKTEIKLQTVEQQRSILRMLEKSWAKELDLEKDLLDSREVEETLKQRMFFTEQKLVNMEEEASDIWERWLEADNANEVLLGISKGLLGRLHISQFSLKGLSHRESELRANLKDAEDKLTLANSKVFSLSDKVSSLEKQLKESDVLLLDAKAASEEYQKQYKCSVIHTKNNEL